MRIGIDVGGSHIGIGVINQQGNLLLKKEKDYNTYEKDMSDIVIYTIIELIQEIKNSKSIDFNDVELIGIACPGTISNGIIVKADNLGIKNLKIKETIEKKFNIPVYVQNDAKCAAMAEKQIGSLKKFNDAIFLVIGTGVGGAVFLEGKLLKPKKYSGFEVGHMVIEKNGEMCNCGRKGCFEAGASIKRLKDKIIQEFKLSNYNGKQIKEFIIQNINDKKMNDIIDNYVEYLGTGIANLINIFEPEAISLGGSFAHYQDILLDRLKNFLVNKNELFNKDSIPELLIAELKNDAGIIGASII